ncbi:uncharacterized protein hmgxb4b [Syngnathus typhle]
MRVSFPDSSLFTPSIGSPSNDLFNIPTTMSEFGTTYLCTMADDRELNPELQDQFQEKRIVILELVSSVMEFLNDKPNEVDCWPHPSMTAPSSPTSITTKPALSLAVAGPSSDRPAASMRRPVGSLWGEMESQNPACCNPANAAAHLHLLGEALDLIGHILKGTKKSVCVSTSLFLLLDSLLCGLAPLMCLTSHIPELHQCQDNVLDSTLENIAYIMPGF